MNKGIIKETIKAIIVLSLYLSLTACSGITNFEPVDTLDHQFMMDDYRERIEEWELDLTKIQPF